MGNLLKTLKDEVTRISKRLGGKPQAIGLGFPGAVDPEVGVVYMPGKIKGLEGYPIVKRLAKVTGIPVIADNDGRISIYAERYYGLARDVDWAVTITLGTGVGSGALLDGKILRDPHLQFGDADESYRHAGSGGAAVPDQRAGHGRDDVLGHGADSAGAGRAGARHSLGLERPVLQGSQLD